MADMKIIYDGKTHAKIMRWVMATTQEVSGFGLCEKQKDGTILVKDAFLLPQKNGGAHTDIEAEDLAKAEFEYKDEPGEIRLWWHSHAEMSVFWSGTDRDTIELLGKHGWMAATVFNRKNEHRSAIYIGGEWNLLLDQVETQKTPLELPKDWTDSWDQEFKTNVTDHETRRLLLARSAGPKTTSLLKEGWQYDSWRVERPLTKGEKALLLRETTNRVVAIAYTWNHGRVIWRESNMDTHFAIVPSKVNPKVPENLYYWYLIEDMKELRWASDVFIEHFLERSRNTVDQPGSSWGKNKYLGELRLTLIEAGARRYGQSFQYPDGNLADDDEGLTIEDMKNMFPNWDSLPEEEQDAIMMGFMKDDERAEIIEAEIAAEREAQERLNEAYLGGFHG